MAPRAAGQSGRHPVAKLKGGWTPEEDALLVRLVKKFGEGNWSPIARALNEATGKTEATGRIGKQCRERWNHHLSPGLRKDPWTAEEERAVVEAHKRLGNRWSDIARCIPGRSENSVKNHWNATLRKRVTPDNPAGPLKEYLDSLNLTVAPRKRSGNRNRKRSRSHDESSSSDEAEPDTPETTTTTTSASHSRGATDGEWRPHRGSSCNLAQAAADTAIRAPASTSAPCGPASAPATSADAHGRGSGPGACVTPACATGSGWTEADWDRSVRPRSSRLAAQLSSQRLRSMVEAEQSGDEGEGEEGEERSDDRGEGGGGGKGEPAVKKEAGGQKEGAGEGVEHELEVDSGRAAAGAPAAKKPRQQEAPRRRSEAGSAATTTAPGTEAQPSTADAPGSTPAPKPPSSQQQQQQAAGLSPFGHPSDPALVRSCSLTASDGPTRCPSAAVLPQPSATGSTMLPHPQHMQPPHQLHLLGAPAVQHGGCFSVPPQPQYHPHHHHHPHHAPALLYHQQPGVLLAAAVPPPQQAAWGFPYSWSSNNIQALGTDEATRPHGGSGSGAKIRPTPASAPVPAPAPVPGSTTPTANTSNAATAATATTTAADCSPWPHGAPAGATFAQATAPPAANATAVPDTATVSVPGAAAATAAAAAVAAAAATDDDDTCLLVSPSAAADEAPSRGMKHVASGSALFSYAEPDNDNEDGNKQTDNDNEKNNDNVKVAAGHGKIKPCKPGDGKGKDARDGGACAVKREDGNGGGGGAAGGAAKPGVTASDTAGDGDGVTAAGRSPPTQPQSPALVHPAAQPWTGPHSGPPLWPCSATAHPAYDFPDLGLGLGGGLSLGLGLGLPNRAWTPPNLFETTDLDFGCPDSPLVHQHGNGGAGAPEAAAFKGEQPPGADEAAQPQSQPQSQQPTAVKAEPEPAGGAAGIPRTVSFAHMPAGASGKQQQLPAVPAAAAALLGQSDSGTSSVDSHGGQHAEGGRGAEAPGSLPRQRQLTTTGGLSPLQLPQLQEQHDSISVKRQSSFNGFIVGPAAAGQPPSPQSGWIGSAAGNPTAAASHNANGTCQPHSLQNPPAPTTFQQQQQAPSPAWHPQPLQYGPAASHLPPQCLAPGKAPQVHTGHPVPGYPALVHWPGSAPHALVSAAPVLAAAHAPAGYPAYLQHPGHPHTAVLVPASPGTGSTNCGPLTASPGVPAPAGYHVPSGGGAYVYYQPCGVVSEAGALYGAHMPYHVVPGHPHVQLLSPMLAPPPPMGHPGMQQQQHMAGVHMGPSGTAGMASHGSAPSLPALAMPAAAPTGAPTPAV